MIQKERRELAFKVLDEKRDMTERLAIKYHSLYCSCDSEFDIAYNLYEKSLNSFIETRCLFFALDLITDDERIYFYNEANRIIHLAHKEI